MKAWTTLSRDVCMLIQHASEKSLLWRIPCWYQNWYCEQPQSFR